MLLYQTIIVGVLIPILESALVPFGTAKSSCPAHKIFHFRHCLVIGANSIDKKNPVFELEYPEEDLRAIAHKASSEVLIRVSSDCHSSGSNCFARKSLNTHAGADTRLPSS